MNNQPLTFEDLFLEENFEHLNKICMKYAANIKKNRTANIPNIPSVMAAEMGLTLMEYTELVGYFNDMYQDEMAERVLSDLQKGEIIKWD